MPRRSQPDRARATQEALIRAGRRLFAEKGYAHVPAEDIVAAAGLSRGALYHHYADKQALFQAVFESVERDIADEIAAVTDAADDTWSGVVAAVGTFVEICQRREVLQIALTDAPAVLGWQKWREIEAAHGLGLITAQLEVLADEGRLAPDSVPALAQLALSAVIEAGLLIAHADDPAAARVQTGNALLVLLGGLVRTDG